MAAKRTPSGKAGVGEQRNQSNVRTGLVTFTGTQLVDLRRSIRTKGAVPTRKEEIAFVVTCLNFEDVGGAATVHRLASVQNGDGTFTINASKESGVAGTYATATNPCTVRWTVLVTN